MTTADRLRAAADKIQHTANGAMGAMGGGPWRAEIGGDGYITRSGEGYVTADRMDEEVAEHVALWDPPTTLLFVPMLRETARRLDNIPSYRVADDVYLFVEAILTGAHTGVK